MLNQVVIVGRLVEDIKTEKVNDAERRVLTLAVPRPFKNVDGTYDTDFINCVLWNGIANNTAEYCKKGDVVGIKGRLQTDENKTIQIIAEKVTFLSSNKEEKEDE